MECHKTLCHLSNDRVFRFQGCSTSVVENDSMGGERNASVLCSPHLLWRSGFPLTYPISTPKMAALQTLGT